MLQPHEAVSSWAPEELGNHRVIVQVETESPLVKVPVPWLTPQHHGGAGLVRTSTGEEAGRAHAVPGGYAFAPVKGRGRYVLYYTPYENAATPQYPQDEYLQPAGDLPEGPMATCVVEAYEARTEHDRYTDLERPAPPQEGFFAFGESREHPIRMRALPARWLERAPGPVRLRADRGDYLVFQIGVYGSRPLRDVRVTCDAPDFTCFTLGGVDYLGRAFTRRLDVAEHTVQALWCGMRISEREFTVRVITEGEGERAVDFVVELTDRTSDDHTDDDPAKLSRLRWLDSRRFADDTVVRPYTPVTVDGDRLGVLGRTVTLGHDGLPAKLTSYFTPEVTAIGQTPAEVLSGPVSFEVPGHDWAHDGWRITAHTAAAVTWVSRWRSGKLTLDLDGRLEFDGTLDYRLELSAEAGADLDDTRLTLPLAALPYQMGLGRPGGRRADLDWRWDVTRNQDALWAGAVNAGVQVRLADEHYVRPLNTNFYHQRPLVLPGSWHNGGRGGVRRDGDRLRCYGGPRRMAAGERLRFDVRLTLTPFKPIDTGAHFRERYFHAYRPAAEIAASGATVVNTHHATEVNPYINYPFLTVDRLREYVDTLHEAGLRSKIYYTVRELTTRAPELWALLSLGDEVLAPGPGGGGAWSREHVGDGRLPAWFATGVGDSSLVTGGQSRWHNFYVEGLDWLVRHVGIDGIYLDDLGFDREVMKRVRRVLDQRPAPLVDLHSANQFNAKDGFASSANLYLEHLPYVDRLWFGEYFDYDAEPDQWLAETCGIPFGVMADMLQDGGHPWRGLVYGMTSRIYPGGNPRAMWRLFDEYGVPDADMYGYWSPSAPVRSGTDTAKATAYVGRNGTLIALGGWQDGPVTLEIDWDRLGLDPRTATLRAPEIEGLQKPAVLSLHKPVPVDGGGRIVWLSGPRSRSSR
ncbi:glycoside hydrolase domain-containing protein [Nonomuraea typhae]|uniref:glycoside hydrolase domain-containing protein n=1 Tax=Nonomuraea typhae TaxID=2603600 RepID=UPI0012F91101|nr:glycoside hydrolase domain-containing protein [Nonomuraea typhae]